MATSADYNMKYNVNYSSSLWRLGFLEFLAGSTLVLLCIISHLNLSLNNVVQPYQALTWW